MTASRFILLALVLSAGTGCTQSDGANLNPVCNPVAAGDCALPWPSSFYLAPDTTTATGFRISIPDGVMPVSDFGAKFDPARLNLMDGFSPAGALIANLKVRVEVTQLPPLANIARSLEPDSKVQLIRYDDGSRVPIFAEVDQNVERTVEDQVVLISPMVRLKPATRYVAVLRGLVDTSGKRIVVPPMEALKEKRAGTRLSTVAPHYEEIFRVTDAAQIPRSDITLAWDFVTGSDTQLLSHIIPMRDEAFSRWEQGNLGAKVDSVEEPTNDTDLFRRILGTFDVPSFVETQQAGTGLHFDAAGKPAFVANQAFPLVIHVPQCAKTATKPLPVMIFGHGLFGSASGEMGSGYEKHVQNTVCMVAVGTNWIGLSEDDAIPAATQVAPDLTKFPMLTDRLQQAQVNFLVLAHYARTRLKDLPELQYMNKPIIDGSEVYYFGLSQGGIEGGTFMALSPDVERGALNVPGGIYSLMLPRSVDFSMLKQLLDGNYPIQRDQQLMMSALQSYWDFSDPITFAPHHLTDTLPGTDGKPLTPRRIVMQESIGDAQVSNVSTRILVRTIGLQLLGTPIESVFGVTAAAGPLDAAYTQWSVAPSPLPTQYNQPLPNDNEAHQNARAIPQLVEQLRRLFQPTGRVEDTCGGVACVYPLMK